MTGEPRVGLRSPGADDTALAAIYDRVTKSFGAVPTLYQVLGNSHEVLDGWIGLGWGLRSASSFDRGLLELAIMRVAQLSGSEYVWRSHWRLALKSGTDKAKLYALGRWPECDLFTDSERAVLALADALTQDVEVPDDVWSEVAARFDDQQRVVLVMTVSWYHCVARVAAGLGVPLEEQHAEIPGLGATP